MSTVDQMVPVLRVIQASVMPFLKSALLSAWEFSKERIGESCFNYNLLI